jgi:hypothetical protein
MPNAAHVACSSPGCPGFALPGGRGRCPAHARSTSQRGYGAAWQAQSRAQRLADPRCAVCGTTADLTADHVVSGDPKRNRERSR